MMRRRALGRILPGRSTYQDDTVGGYVHIKRRSYLFGYVPIAPILKFLPV
ncbi:MAG: hypothetical protein LLG42_03085 [Chloroflexi bacterium]|nr:hypothetical protein [Chloroflexota bacterium]